MDLSKLKLGSSANCHASTITRRSVLQTGLASTGLVFTGASSAFGIRLPERADRYPEKDFWQGLIGQHFHVTGYASSDLPGSPRTARLVLTEVKGIVPKVEDPARPEFFRPHAVSLLFRGSGKYVLPSTGYELLNLDHGSFHLLLTHTHKHPSRRFRRSNMYEAILN